MELQKPNYTARWIYPFPEEPETGVQVRKLNDAEVNRIYDKNKYVPGSKSATVSRATAVLNDIIASSVMDWKGFTQDGVELECNRENKLLMLERRITNSDGEQSTVWGVVTKKFEDLQESDIKN